MTRECSCGATFDTLTELRLHQRDECPDRGPEIGIADADTDDIAATVVEELLICDACGERNDGAEEISREYTDAGLSVELTFECTHCLAQNENTAILSGGETA